MIYQMQQHPDQDMILALRILPMPEHTNISGNVFGGYIMGQVDLAATGLAAHRSLGPVVTVAVDKFEFRRPVRIGDMLSIWGKVTQVGSTSLNVHVEVWAESLKSRAPAMVTDANLTFVAVNEDGSKRTIAETAEDLVAA